MTSAGDFQPLQASTPRVGRITQWVDDKGYGWIAAGGHRVFAHIKDFERGQRRLVAVRRVGPRVRALGKSLEFLLPSRNWSAR